VVSGFGSEVYSFKKKRKEEEKEKKLSLTTLAIP